MKSNSSCNLCKIKQEENWRIFFHVEGSGWSEIPGGPGKSVTCRWELNRWK